MKNKYCSSEKNINGGKNTFIIDENSFVYSRSENNVRFIRIHSFIMCFVLISLSSLEFNIHTLYLYCMMMIHEAYFQFSSFLFSLFVGVCCCRMWILANIWCISLSQDGISNVKIMEARQIWVITHISVRQGTSNGTQSHYTHFNWIECSSARHDNQMSMGSQLYILPASYTCWWITLFICSRH